MSENELLFVLLVLADGLLLLHPCPIFQLVWAVANSNFDFSLFFGIFEHDSFALLPEIFPVNATIILPIYGVLFSTFKQYDYLLLVCNVGWLGLPSVMCLGRHVLGCGG